MEIARRLMDITLYDAKESYRKLRDEPCRDPRLSRIGLHALDYYFLQHRIKAKTKGISFYDAITNDDEREHLTEMVRRWKKNMKPEDYDDPIKLLKMQYSVFQLYYGTINQFRPMAAKWLYCQLNPKVGILDFSAGWGGRCLAAMAMGIPYIGIDANVHLETPYRKMIQTYGKGEADVMMIFKPSETVDFSKFDYDLVFTSPPYFMIEKYENMPAYVGKQAFIDEFFEPVVTNAWKYLKNGGYMALNMPHEMYMSIRHALPKLHSRKYLPLHDRRPHEGVEAKQTKKRGGRGGTRKRQKGVPHEIIYIWKKMEGGEDEGNVEEE